MAKTTGAKTFRSETVGVRLDPKLLYLAEIAARIQGRTLSSFIEWSIRQVLLSDVEANNGATVKSLGPMANEEFWDIDEAVRVWKLATGDPTLLTITEQKIWRAYLDAGGKESDIEHFRKMFPTLKTNASK